MRKKIYSAMLVALTASVSLSSLAYVDADCDPETTFCIFIQGDSSLKTEIDVQSSLKLSLRQSDLEYPEHALIKANFFKVVGLPASFIKDAKITDINFNITAINNQPISHCHISTQVNKLIKPTFHIITLSETHDQNQEEVQYHCTVN